MAARSIVFGTHPLWSVSFPSRSTRINHASCRATCSFGRRIAATRVSRSPSCTRLARLSCCKPCWSRFAAVALGSPSRANSRFAQFLAGRIDLTQAEAVLGVIDAEQADQLRTALGQLAGGLAKPLHQLREELLHLLAEIEAGLDFVEEDIEFISAAELRARLQAIGAELHDVAAQLNSRSVETAAVQLVLIGPPNAGKSSLFNAMIRRFAAANAAETSAIVSAERGTTRDYLTATIDLGVSYCTLIDTAGIESSPVLITTDEASQKRSAEISVAAQNLSGEVRRQATLRALCVDVSLAELGAALGDIDCDLLVLTQADRTAVRDVARHRDARVPVVVTSSVTGDGLEEFRTAIRDLLSAAAQPNRGAAVAATAERCRESLCAAESALGRATEMAETQTENELIAAELRGALTELGKVVGAVYTDDILDRIFSSFCIGK